MKFAFVSTMWGWQWGGCEELWSRAATQLRLAGHEVQAWVEYWPSLSPALLALEEKGIELATHYLHNSAKLPLAGRVWHRLSGHTQRSFRRLQRFRPDLVVISQGYVLDGFAWQEFCRQAGLPYVIIVQCNSENWWFGDDLSLAVASYTAAEKVFCVSRHNLDLLRLQTARPLPNAEVLFNPYNVTPEAAPDWPGHDQIWRLASVARMDLGAKGQDLLLQVLAQPEWKGRPIALNFYGKGRDESVLRGMAERLGLKNVYFHGHVNDVKAIWEQNHMLVLPSRYEGLPLALVEAMWCARPAVVTDVGGNAELCLDGKTGFVAEAAVISSVARALERAWSQRQEWTHLGQAGRVRVEAVVPRDPVGLICQKLQDCVTRKMSARPD